MFRYWTLLALLLALAGCELPRENRPSVLVVAVEGLSFDTLSCDSDQIGQSEFAGIRVFCDEAVRFTHAFSPSTMSQATMASLLTSLYPFDHGVRHNGSDFLSARFHTLAEGALEKGYRTLFVSGGAPIWRKSGLAQGFEVFDDSVEISPSHYYRPASEVVKTATNWVERETEGGSFLAVLYLADLQFPQIATMSSEGELRERSPAAQLEAVAESLTQLTSWLKSKKRWNKTNIILVGLNSIQRREGDREPAPLSLKSNGVQVTLFVKPARREGDNVIQWAIDRNISLVDVGKTLFQWIGVEPQKGSIAAVEPEGLAQALTQSDPQLNAERLIWSETAWPDWLEGTGVRISVRQSQFLYVHDVKPMIFNMWADRMENSPLRPSDPLWISLGAGVQSFIKQTGLPAWKGMQSHWPEQISAARGNTSGQVLPRWAIRQALQKRDWKTVKKLAVAAGDHVAAFIAAKQMGEYFPPPMDPCIRLILPVKGDKKSYDADCDDERVLAMYVWQRTSRDEDKISAADRFARLQAQHEMDQDIGRLNYLNDLRWDVDRDWPETPTAADYLITLKELSLLNGKNLSL